MWNERTIRLIEAACEEDLGTVGDITCVLLADADADSTGRVVMREPGVICGLALAPRICGLFSKHLGQPLEFAASSRGGRVFVDGAAVGAGTCVAAVRGPRAAVLALERTLLNFLGRMSGVATLTRRFVEAARQANPRVQILDTRKTLPGWRELDKYAVRCGGGQNHRFGLYDAVLIKDNHLAGIPTDRLADALREMLRRVAKNQPEAEARAQDGGPGPPYSRVGPPSPTPAARTPPIFVEIEVDNLEQFVEVCKVPGVDIVLLDNFTSEQMRAAVAHRDAIGPRFPCERSAEWIRPLSSDPARKAPAEGTLLLEASGGITLECVAEIAATGVDRISVGGLTHSATALDIGLDLA